MLVALSSSTQAFLVYANGKPAARLSTPFLRQWGPHFFRGGSAPDLPPEGQGADGQLLAALLRNASSSFFEAGAAVPAPPLTAEEEALRQQKLFWGADGRDVNPLSAVATTRPAVAVAQAPAPVRLLSGEQAAASAPPDSSARGAAAAPRHVAGGETTAERVAAIIADFQAKHPQHPQGGSWQEQQLKQQQIVPVASWQDEAAAVAVERRAGRLLRGVDGEHSSGAAGGAEELWGGEESSSEAGASDEVRLVGRTSWDLIAPVTTRA